MKKMKEDRSMPTSKANARWEGTLKTGQGTMKVGSGAFEGAYSFATRFEGRPGTNPEELIGAAHAGCFSMALSLLLEQAGHPPRWIETSAEVTLGPVGDGFAITDIRLKTKADVPGMDPKAFREQAEAAKKGCPVSKALAGTKIELEAALAG
jgi:lipoyl-dependent peroxiredoxin